MENRYQNYSSKSASQIPAPVPTESQEKAFYEANRATLFNGRSFAQVRDLIVNFLETSDRNQGQARYLNELQRKFRVAYIGIKPPQVGGERRFYPAPMRKEGRKR